jgi:hypothetical protein
MGLLKAGSRLYSASSTVEVIVTKAPKTEVELHCGGVAMTAVDKKTDHSVVDVAGSTEMGKRYIDSAGQLELLCTKAGAGSLSLNGEALQIRGSKALPSSD